MNTHFRQTLVAILSRLPAPVFLAGFEAEKSKLTLHVRSGFDTADLRTEAERAITLAGVLLQVDVRGHRLSKLTHPRSLEHWLKRFGTGEILHDPTHIVSRARGVLEAANSCRSTFGNLVTGNFFDPARRTLVVCTRLVNDAAKVLAMRLGVAGIVEDAWNRAVAYLDETYTRYSRLNVEVVSDLPVRDLVPVDSRSASLASRLGFKLRHWVATAAMAVAVLAGGAPAHAGLQTEFPSASLSSSEALGEWGVLTGLTVFVDGARSNELVAFASSGLQLYFGDGTLAGTVGSILVADARKTKCIEQGKPTAECENYVGS